MELDGDDLRREALDIRKATLASLLKRATIAQAIMVFGTSRPFLDIKGFAAANGHEGKSDDDIRAAMGDKFPKHIYHSIVCIGALIAHHDGDHWSLGRFVGSKTVPETMSWPLP